MTKLTVGDKVIWRGAWGKDIPKEATVTHIDYPYGKQDIRIKSVDWDFVMSGRDIIVSLSNGSWAYGFQLSEIKL